MLQKEVKQAVKEWVRSSGEDVRTNHCCSARRGRDADCELERMEGQRSGSALPWSSPAKGNKDMGQQPTWVEAVKKGIYHEKTCHVCVLQVPSP